MWFIGRLTEISAWHGSKKFIILLDMVYGYDKTNFLTELASVWPCIALQLTIV